MPIKRQLTDEEKSYYEAQGYDTSKIPAEGIDVYSPDEIAQQQRVEEAKKSGMLSAIGNTLRGHAGSLMGGAGATLGATALLGETIAAPFTGGGTAALIPATLGLMGVAGAGALGSTVGQGVQRAIVPQATEQDWEQKAAAAREAYPKTSIGTDITAGALLGGGRPSLAVPDLAASGLKKLAISGGKTALLAPEEMGALHNIVTMNAANTGINAGMQYATTGKVDPTELASSALAGAIFSQPNIIGRKVLGWEPLSKSPARSLQKEPEGFTMGDGNLERASEYQARQKQAQTDYDIQQRQTEAANSYSQQEQARVEAETAKANQDRVAFHNLNTLTVDPNFPLDAKGNKNYSMSNRIVNDLYNKRNEIDIPKGADDTTRAQIKAQNELMRKTPISDKRDELFHQDYATKDPEGYTAFQQQEAAKKAAADAANTANNQRIFQNVQEINAKAAADKIRAARHLEWVKAEAERKQEVVQQAQEAQRVKAQQEAEAWKQRQEGKKGLSENTQRILNTKSIAEGMMGGGVQQQQPGAIRYQAPTDREGAPITSKLTPEAAEQARRNLTTVGQLGDKEGLIITDPTHPNYGQEALAGHIDPKKLGERIALLTRKSVPDSLYHELLHGILMDMDRSGDPYLQQLANKMRRVHGTEERLAQQGGKQYQNQVEGRKKFMQRTGDMLKDVYAGAAARFGTENPGLLRRHLIALSRIEKTPGTPLIEAANRAAGITHVSGATGMRYQNADEENKTRHVEGGDFEHLIEGLGESAYNKEYSATVIKEMTQNAFDAVENSPSKVIKLHIDPKAETLGMEDNGKGMTPEEVVTKLLPIAASGKDASKDRGGYGFAKAIFFRASEWFKVATSARIADGRLMSTFVEGNGKAWMRYIKNGADLPADLNHTGIYNLTPDGGLRMTVQDMSHIPNNQQASGTKITVKPHAGKFNENEAASMAGNLAQYEPGKIKIYDQKGNLYNRYTAASNAPVHTVETPGATIHIRYDPTAESEGRSSIPILNKGLFQLWQRFDKEVKVPWTIMDVNPKVGTAHPDYPYTNNRDSLKGTAKTEVEKLLEGLSSQYKQKVNSMFLQRVKDVATIPGTRQKFLDVTGKMDKNTQAEIVTNPTVMGINAVLARLHREAFLLLQRREGPYWKDAEYKGLAHGGGFLGVRFGTPSPGSEGHIYYDLEHILQSAQMHFEGNMTSTRYRPGSGDQRFISGDKVEGWGYGPGEHGLAVGNEAAGVVLHELAHQISDEEGETHAKAMTSMAGRLGSILERISNGIAKVFDNNDTKVREFYDWYKSKISNATISESEANRLISEGKGKTYGGPISSPRNRAIRAALDRGNDAEAARLGHETTTNESPDVRYQSEPQQRIGVSSGEEERPSDVAIGLREPVTKGTDVTKLPSYDHSRSFDKGDGGNYWMSREGHMIPVRQHVQFGREFAASHGLPETTSAYDTMFEKGFHRVVIGNNTVHVEPSNGKSIPESTLAKLRDFAIENGKDAVILDAARPKALWSKAMDEGDSGVRYQSPTDELAAKDSAHTPWTLPLFRSMQDEVARISPVVAKALGNFGERFDLLRGQLTEDVIGKLKKFINPFNFKELYTQDNADMRAVIDRLKDIYYDGESKIKLTPKQQEIDGVVRESYLKSVALKNKYSDVFGETKPDPNYIAIMPGRKALEILLNEQKSPERAQLVKDFYELHEGKLDETHEEATKKLETFLRGYNKEKVDLAQQFGPIDKAAGEIAIPRSWSENNLIDVMARFNNRYARRIAFHEAFERNPEAYKEINDPIGGIQGSDALRNALEEVSGKVEFIEAKRQAASGLVRAAMLGPLTGAKDFVSNLVLGFQHQTPGQAVASALHSWGNMRENIAESFAAGINRHNIGVMEMGDSIGLGDIVNIMRRSRDVLNTVQGRNFLEQMTRATAYGQGKFLAMDNIKAASKGDLRGQRKQFLDDMAPGWEQYKASGEFPPEELMAIASRYVRSVQGSYDFRGLPHIAQRGTLAPYLSLARWNIEKTNNFVKYNIEPMRNGNPIPLLMSTLGMFLGGTALTKLVEMATNKKQRTPEWGEIADAKAQGKDVTQATIWKLTSLASLSGYLGMVGDLTKSVMDLQMKNRPQTWDNPLLTGISSVAGNAWDVVEAAQSGDLKLTADVLGNFLEDTTQVYRLALNNLSSEKKEQLAKSDKMRDLRVYKQVSGEDVGEVSKDRPNPYIDQDVKKFKQTSDMNEAVSLLPSLIKRAFDKAGGDYEKLNDELSKLKHNNYQTMPSLEHMPLSFFRYYNSLARTQGDAVARDRMMDYVRQNAVNQAKSSLVP